MTHCKDDIPELVTWEGGEEKVEDDAEVSNLGTWENGIGNIWTVDQ